MDWATRLASSSGRDNVDGQLALGHAGDLLELGAKAVDLGALLTDDDARTGGKDDDLHLVTSALDLDAGDGGTGETLVQELADLEVVTEGLSVVLLSEPAGAPVLGDAKTETSGVNFLTHDAYASFRGATMMVMWLVRLRMREAEPLARGRMRFRVGPSST